MLAGVTFLDKLVLVDLSAWSCGVAHGKGAGEECYLDRSPKIIGVKGLSTNDYSCENTDSGGRASGEKG